MAQASEIVRTIVEMNSGYHKEKHWKHRPPPTGLTSHEFRLCKQFEKHLSCRLGLQCVEAHGIEEFNEWVIRWKIKKERVAKQIENKASVEQSFLEKLQLDCDQEGMDKLLVNSLPFAEINIKVGENVTLASKPAYNKWMLYVTSTCKLQDIALLQDNHRDHFIISNVQENECKGKIGTVSKNQQEWNNTTNDMPSVLVITIKFKANVYGSFNQVIVFNFGCKPYLSKQLKVDVYPLNEGLELSEDGKQLTVSTEKQWTDENAEIIRLPSPPDEQHTNYLKAKYPHPGHGFQFPVLFQNSPMDASNYKEHMKALLYIEELAQIKILSRFNLCGNLMLTTHYILSPGPLSTAKYCNGKNELFGKLELTSKISEDTAAGRLILNNCNIALLSFGLDVHGKEILQTSNIAY